MKRRTIILSISSVAAVAMVAVVSVAAGPGGAIAHGRWGGHGAKALCSDQRDIRLSAATGFVEAFVSFTPEQTASWNTLKAALEAGSRKVGAACVSAEAQGDGGTAPQRLARVELALGTALEIVQDVRPAFDDLYAKLSDEQRTRIDEMISKRGRHRR